MNKNKGDMAAVWELISSIQGELKKIDKHLTRIEEKRGIRVEKIIEPPTKLASSNIITKKDDLRTNPFEEGEYDEVIKPTAEPEVNQTHHSSPPGVEADLKQMFNQVNLSAHCIPGSEPYMDGKIFESSFQNIQYLIHKPSHSPGIGPTVKTCQLDPNLPDLDISALNGGFQSNQEELSYKPRCYRNIIHQRVTPNWNQLQINFGLGVIQFLKQRIFDLPYLDLSAFKEFTLQQLLYFWFVHEIETLQVTKKVPRKLTYPPKPSRYKGNTTFPHLAKIKH